MASSASSSRHASQVAGAREPAHFAQFRDRTLEILHILAGVCSADVTEIAVEIGDHQSTVSLVVGGVRGVGVPPSKLACRAVGRR